MPCSLIDKPGIYKSISMDRYHGQLTKTPSISSSGLRTISNKSPKHYYDGSYLNPSATQKKSDCFRLGKAAHSYLLGDEIFDQHFVLSRYADFRTTDARDWKRSKENEGLIVLKQAELDIIKAMGEELKRHEDVKAGLLDGLAEHSIIWKDIRTGVWLKARPDVLPKDRFVVDYKSCADAHPNKTAYDVAKFGYHQQLALVEQGLMALGYEQLKHYILVFQEKTPPYAVTVQRLDRDYIEAGHTLNRAAIAKFADCLATGQWPGYPSQAELYPSNLMLDKAAWAADEIAERYSTKETAA